MKPSAETDFLPGGPRARLLLQGEQGLLGKREVRMVIHAFLSLAEQDKPDQWS